MTAEPTVSDTRDGDSTGPIRVRTPRGRDSGTDSAPSVGVGLRPVATVGRDSGGWGDRVVGDDGDDAPVDVGDDGTGGRDRSLPVETVYEGSDGRYYTDWEVERAIAAGEWLPCLRDEASGRRLVGTGGALLMLHPIAPESLPDWIELRVAGGAVRAVDTRRTVP